VAAGGNTAVFSDNTATPTTQVAQAATTTDSNRFTLTVIVLPGNYYKATNYLGSLINWIEYT
jgi:hypothetical protein